MHRRKIFASQAETLPEVQSVKRALIQTKYRWFHRQLPSQQLFIFKIHFPPLPWSLQGINIFHRLHMRQLHSIVQYGIFLPQHIFEVVAYLLLILIGVFDIASIDLIKNWGFYMFHIPKVGYVYMIPARYFLIMSLVDAAPLIIGLHLDPAAVCSISDVLDVFKLDEDGFCGQSRFNDFVWIDGSVFDFRASESAVE